MARTGRLLFVAVAGIGAAAYCHQAAEVSGLTAEVEALRRGRDDPEPRRWMPGSAPRQHVSATVPVDEPVAIAGNDSSSRRGAETLADPRSEDDGADDRTTRAARWNAAVQRSHDAIEANFRGESVDTSWAVAANRDLRERISSALSATVSVRELDCRSSLCQAVLRVSDATDATRLTQQLFGDRDAPGWRGPAVVLPPRPGGDGSFDIVLYLGREGTRLPRGAP